MESATPFPSSFDAYLRYAIDTDFAYFGGDTGELVLSLLVRLKPDRQLLDLDQALQALGKDYAVGPMQFEDDRMRLPQFMGFLTLRAPVSLVAPDTWGVWELLACWVRLSMPVRSRLLPGTRSVAARPKSESPTVVAVIDDGCAFAHERIRVDPLDSRSRVFAIWDQDPDPREPPGMVGTSDKFGRMPSDFAYGIEYRRASEPGQTIGIDDWTAAHRTPGGGVDEEACYREAGFAALRPRCSHGTHVMDVLAGHVPPSSRHSADPKTPPSFEAAPSLDVAGLAATDIVFVQIPRSAVEDPTGGWLDQQVTNALFYILSCIEPTVTRRVILNLSYGPTTGPHDGKSVLEFVLSVFTRHFDGSGGVRPELNVILPAGNSRLRDWHLAFTSTPAALTWRWTWRVPPDNPVPVFAELWVPLAQAGHVTALRVLPPATAAPGPGPIIERSKAPCSDSAGWLIALPPTRAVPAAPVPGQHGDWTVEMTLSQPDVKVDAYIARSDPNMGARTPGKPTRFLDLEWERLRGASARQTLKDGARDIAGSRIDRRGTLNGIGTVMEDGILVAAGYRLRDGVSSRYSSQGPSRPELRKGPDWALPTDESAALQGLRAAGNRSAAVLRLVGTSSAAPQLARLQARATHPGSCSLPGAAADIGCGKLDAP